MKYLKKFKTDVDYSIKRENEYEEPWVSLTVAKGGDVESFKGLVIETGEELQYDFFCEDKEMSNSFTYAPNLSECQITSVVYDGDLVSSFTTNENDVFQNDGGNWWGCENHIIVGDYEVENIEILADLGGLSAATVNGETYIYFRESWMGVDLEQEIETGKYLLADDSLSIGDIVTVFIPLWKSTYLTEEEIVVGKNIKVAEDNDHPFARFPNKVLGVGQIDAYGKTRVIEILESETGETLNKVDYDKTEREKLAEMPLTFDIICGGTIIWFAARYNTSATHNFRKYIRYSINGGDWVRIQSSIGSGTRIDVNAGDSVRLLGNNETYISFGNYGALFYNQIGSASTAVFAVKGNIMSMIYGDDFKDKTSFQGERGRNLYNFFGASGLTDASKLILAGMGASCYSNLFNNCTGLIKAPELPATTLSGGCYYSMFEGCTSLTVAPKLPATTLGSQCYGRMFARCTSLTRAPKLPATTLVNYCYQSMFWGCTALTAVPELPATTLADYCYNSMFYGCASLTTAPKLPAETLANWCYEGMFQGCTNLTSAPSLPATTLAEYCYGSMFEGCTSLTSAPELPATTLAIYCYSNMFNGCRSLTQAPSLPATTLAIYCYNHMFNGCTNLTTAPELPATALANYCYNTMFSGCTSLVTAPSVLPATILTEYCYQHMFNGCEKITVAPVLSATTLAVSCCESMFSGCRSLTTVQPALPATTLAKKCYYDMFVGCTSLTIAPSLPATTLANNCYQYMFSYCTNLTQAPATLPATTLAINCYYSMFSGCQSLATAPELSASTLVNYCYYQMFKDCSRLNYIKCLATDISATSCTNGWVQGVQQISGTFVKAASMSSWPSGASGIPNNWTVQDA